MFSDEDQLSLNPFLELYIFSRTDAGCTCWKGKGLDEQPVVRTKSWKVRRQQFPAAPDLVNAVSAAADRLGLRIA